MFPLARNSFLIFLCCFCLVFVVPASSVQAARQLAQWELQDLIVKQIAWDEDLPNDKNPSGLQLQFAKADETVVSGKHRARYRVYVAGAPENKKYSLGVWRIGSEMKLLRGDVFVNSKGLLMTHKPRPEEENTDFVGDSEFQLFVQAARGEPVRFALISADKQLFIPGTVVPFPIEELDQGCTLEARLVVPDAQGVLIHAEGLKPNTELPFQALTSGELKAGKFNVNALGHATASEFPYGAGGESGSLKVSVAAKECSTSVEIPWGSESYSLY